MPGDFGKFIKFSINFNEVFIQWMIVNGFADLINVNQVFPFIAQLVTLLFTGIRGFVYLLPFQSRLAHI